MYKSSYYNIDKVINGEEVIYNSVTKAFMSIDPDTSLPEIVQEMNKFPNNMQYSELVENGFIVLQDENEFKKVKFLFDRKFFDNSQLNLILVPTMECNFACEYCFEEPFRNSVKKKDYFETIEKYVKKYSKFYTYLEMSLFGGEPLLFSSELINLINNTSQICKEVNTDFGNSIITNGSLLTEDIMSELIKNNCKMMQITIDGSRETHDQTRKFKTGKKSYDLIMGKINDTISKYLDVEEFHFILRINLNNNSNEEILETLESVLPEYRSKMKVYFRAVYDTEMFEGNNENSSADFNDLYKMAVEIGYNTVSNIHYNRSCESCTNENFLYILPDLTVWKCLNVLSQEKAQIGFIDDDGELQLDGNKIFDWYQALNCFEDKKCMECKLLPDCLGGCILHNINHGSRVCSEFEMVSLPYFYAE